MQIMKSLKRDDLDLEDLSSLSEISDLTGSYNSRMDEIDTEKVRFDRPFSIGINLALKSNPLEVGNHLIDRVEAGSASEKAGLKVNSKLVKINEVGCEDKTHEFVMFYLNYVLRKTDIRTVELVVKEPFYLPSATNITRKPHRATSFSSVQTLHENFGGRPNNRELVYEDKPVSRSSSRGLIFDFFIIFPPDLTNIFSTRINRFHLYRCCT